MASLTPVRAALLVARAGLIAMVGLIALVGPACAPEAPGLPPVEVPVAVLDVLERFAAGEARVLASHEDFPLELNAGLFARDTPLASDADRRVLRAHAESAFELDVAAEVLGVGARLEVTTFVYTPFRSDPQRADPAPVTFRVLADDELLASLRSDYILEDIGGHAYDQMLRTLQLDLSAWEGRDVTLRFETTRLGEPPPAEGVVAPEVGWWDARLLARARVPRQRAGPRAPNLLVLCVDTLAAKRTSLRGYDRQTTPTLAALAEQGTVFLGAQSASSWTLPSTASLFSGLAPNTHGVLGDGREYLLDGVETWAEALAARGLEGAAFVANPLVVASSNFDQGFHTWVHTPRGGADAAGEGGRAASGDEAPAWHDADADELNRHLLDWLDGQPPGGRWFAYVHYMDPHAPYDAPGADRERFTGGYQERRDFSGHLPGALQRGAIEPFSPEEQEHVVDLYDGEVYHFDRRLAELLESLERRGLRRDTVLVVTADHGEELFEHGRLGHGYDLHDEMLSVPLVLVGPGIPAGRVVQAPVTTAALANTLRMLGGAEPSPAAAPPLLPVSDVERRGETVFALTRTRLFGAPRTLVSATHPEGRKVVVEVDDEGRAVGEARRLRRTSGAWVPDPEGADQDGLVEAAVAWARSTARARLPQPRPDVDLTDALRQVGYLGEDPPEVPLEEARAGAGEGADGSAGQAEAPSDDERP